jgi:hypothetical protein
MRTIENHDAQFMLLAGFIIAIGLVITTVILNSIIFERNIAVGAGNDPTKNDIINLIQITRDEGRAAYANATISSTNKINMMVNFNNTLQNFNDNLSTTYALQGEGVNMTLDTSNWYNNQYPNFTDSGTANGAPNWTVIQNVTSSTVKVNITPYIIPPFTINFTNVYNKTNTWQINFTPPGHYIINFNNTQITKNITSPYTISFINGANAAGNYSIIGNTTNGRNFTRARDFILNETILLSTSKAVVNLTIPVSVP